MIGIWVMVSIIILFALGLIGFFIYIACDGSFYGGVIGIIVTIIVAGAICGGSLWWLYNTESGARAIKDYQSNVTGGISRTVTVYDISGEVIKTYDGKFDVEYDSDRIKFDDENGKRHVIYYTTGTVIVDEK